MVFRKSEPGEALKPYVREFWVFENPDPTIQRQKIIPDGFCEIIFHYGDPYRLKLSGRWKTQARWLLAGQISRHFFLENTGVAGMIGVNLRPTAPYQLFGLQMVKLTDRVVDLEPVLGRVDMEMSKIFNSDMSPGKRMKLVERWLERMIRPDHDRRSARVTEVVETIFRHKGLNDIESFSKKMSVSSRHLERDFKNVVGLTSKFFCRIIRFNHIFEVMKTGDARWIDIALRAGYFDQSHFIKNFKEFTGENPSQYGFEEKNLANFFLRK